MTDALRAFADAEDGLRFEAALFAANGPRVGLWEAQNTAIVCPSAYARKPEFAAAAKASEEAGWPVYLRPTGGGAVPQGPGVTNVVLSFDAPAGSTIEDGYRLLINVIISAWGPPGRILSPGLTAGSFCDGAWNLSALDKKIVGTAQRWRPVANGQPRVLAHAMILTNDRFRPGVSAVAAFHAALGLEAIDTDAHTSLQAALGIDTLPVTALYAAAQDALDNLHTHSHHRTETMGGNHVQRNHPHPS